ncbi:Pyridoxamine phosphate oxidase family protein [Pleurostoma richardsiae]|uniref:Pyridoxamine phosphate oxidase family protein n=1 Tax=Pleurostoma richardsiae TaxID=41990 RepID=A0AA38RJU2_9PEZI|nr:Pyridoxamine phosphate oxidase family protein [Pleurostoma richardsiae]
MKLLPELTPELTAWALQQPVFFVASAPLHGRHINVSPKGLPSSTFSVLSPGLVAYLDRTGSGCETIAHLYERGNGRLTVMFMSVGPQPRILRLFCRGRVVEWDAPGFDGWLGRMGQERPDAVRSVIVCEVFQVSTSCGYGVPRVKREVYAGAGLEPKGGKAAAEDGTETTRGEKGGWKGGWRWEEENSVFEDRPTLPERAAWREKAGKTLAYQVEVNLDSLDGLPGLRVARREAGQWLWVTDAKAYMKRILAEKEAIIFGFLLAVLLYGVLSSSTRLLGVLETDRLVAWKTQLQALPSRAVRA